MLIQSRQIEVVCLRGPLFFGIAANLVTQIEDLIYSVDPAPFHLILDMGQVTAFDHSAAEAFMRIHHTADKNGITLNIVGADEWGWLLEREGLIDRKTDEAQGREGGRDRIMSQIGPHHTILSHPAYAVLNWPATLVEKAQQEEVGVARWFKTLDQALEACENDVLDRLEGEHQLTRTASGHYGQEWEEREDGEIRPKLFYPQSLRDDLTDENIIAMSGMEPQDWRALLDECEQLTLSRGDMLYTDLDICESVFILTHGCLKITPASSRGSRRVASRLVTALALIGFEALVGRQGLRDEYAVARSEEAIVYKLTQEKLEAMRRDKQDLYIAFADNLAARALCANRAAHAE